jgi:hypothetical protein
MYIILLLEDLLLLLLLLEDVGLLRWWIVAFMRFSFDIQQWQLSCSSTTNSSERFLESPGVGYAMHTEKERKE